MNAYMLTSDIIIDLDKIESIDRSPDGRVSLAMDSGDPISIGPGNDADDIWEVIKDKALTNPKGDQ